jgi:hypothetical protein
LGKAQCKGCACGTIELYDPLILNA